MIKRLFVFTLAIVLVLTITSAVFAQDEIPPCTGDAAEGTLVSFDEATNTVVIAYDPGDGSVAFCSVTFQQDVDYGHPITTLLGNYFEQFFGSYDPEGFTTALESTQVCVEPGSEEGTYVLTDPQDPCSGTTASLYGSNGDGSFLLLFGDGSTGTLVVASYVPAEADTVCVVAGTEPDTYVLAETQEPCGDIEATITGDNGDGTYPITFEGGSGTLVGDDFATLTQFEDALAGLMGFSSALSEDGIAAGVGDAINEYHDEGFGFGVIVKLYGIALDNEMDPDELFQMFSEGMGMGQLFKEYGKPGLLGVGHVRQATDGFPGASGQCNPNANPNSAAGCPVEDGGFSTDAAQTRDAHKNKEKTNHGNGNNNGKGKKGD